jgi:xylulose-5-phosphate/fructose-6-phosphate phosphoketolase
VDARRLLTINTGSSSLKAALYRLFDMVVLNGMSRYHLAAEALRRAGAASGLRSGDRAPNLISECEAAIARVTAYSREHFEDPPEIRNWTWTR